MDIIIIAHINHIYTIALHAVTRGNTLTEDKRNYPYTAQMKSGITTELLAI